MEPLTSLSQLSDQLASLVGSAGSHVIQVASRHRRPATGTVFAPERVITVAHAVDRREGLAVIDPGRSTKAAELVGIDIATDLAVVRVPGLGAEPAQRGGEPRPGELVVALARTLSGSLAASAGIASVIGGPLRTGRGPALEQVLRADVRVHPLGAGGLLVDAAGHALGIATGAVMRGMPLFVPASIAWRVAEAVNAHGTTRRGFLGVSAQPVRLPERQRVGRSQEFGLLVVGVAGGSPAEQGGILLGDLVVGFDAQAVEDHDALLALLTGDRVGRSVNVDLVRGGDPKTVAVVVGERE